MKEAMNASGEDRQQMYQRLLQLSDLAVRRKRELESTGETRARSGRENDDYLTAEERREFFHLTRELAGVTIQNDRAYCQGKSWQLPVQKNI